MNQTQRDLIAKHLTQKPITSIEAIHLYGCTRLSAVIHHLRRKGAKIVSENLTVRSRQGLPCSVTRYSLIRQA